MFEVLGFGFMSSSQSPIAALEPYLVEKFVRASGPGGQNVNKVATAVDLRLNVADAPLSSDVKARLLALAGNRVTVDGWIVIEAREYRTQAQNREAARARLGALLAQASKRPKSRRATRPTAGSKTRRLESKQRRAAVKKNRRRGSDE